MKKSTIIILFFILKTVQIQAQSISTSPYSVYGLGSLYESDFGPISAMGSTGIALESSTFINNKNPASLASTGLNSFFFDFGAKAISSIYEDNSKKEKKKNFQFSHIAFAFPINSKSGASFALKPYSSASYVISDYKLKIENSNEDYILDADSKGGLNVFDVSYGYKISKKMALGITTSFYFGNIEDKRSLSIANSLTSIEKNSNYKGIRFTLGNQLKITPSSVLGITLKTPSKINASKIESIYSANGSETEVVQDDIVSDATNYYLPLEIGIGYNKIFKNRINVSFDFEKSFWNMTNQSSIYGDYTNQDKFSLGFSYLKNKRSINFLEKINYFSGVNYDSGFIVVNNEKVNNMAFSVGIGIPLERTNSLLNLSYTYGTKGKVSHDLIKENYHKIGINLSFEAIWFEKRKYN